MARASLRYASIPCHVWHASLLRLAISVRVPCVFVKIVAWCSLEVDTTELLWCVSASELMNKRGFVERPRHDPFQNASDMKWDCAGSLHKTR